LILRAVNITRQRVVASRLKARGTYFGRLIGLLGRSCLYPGEALWISPCRAIHTFGMRFTIDVIFLDHGHTVVKAAAGIAPFRVCLGGREAKSVIELAAGTIEQSGTQTGDRIELIKDV
jgi:hypothetical protein